MIFKNVNLNYAVLSRLIEKNYDIEKYCEMTKEQSAFLCGLLRECKPTKILEVGVAAGGTTAVILECLNELGYEGEMYSVDTSEERYRGGVEKTGFFKDRVIEKSTFTHKFLLGKPIPYVIEEIGKGIDFLILDTTHVLPGELLDFIVCYPFLTNNCTVVLHDVIENLLTRNESGIATKLLFDTIVANKYYGMNQDIYKYGFSNIAAFRLNDNSNASINNVLSALTFTWKYELGNDEISYKSIIKKYYSSDQNDWFERILKIQFYRELEDRIARHYNRNIKLLKMNWENTEEVYLYGAGYWARLYTLYANENGFKINGYIISNEQDKKI